MLQQFIFIFHEEFLKRIKKTSSQSIAQIFFQRFPRNSSRISTGYFPGTFQGMHWKIPVGILLRIPPRISLHIFAQIFFKDSLRNLTIYLAMHYGTKFNPEIFYFSTTSPIARFFARTPSRNYVKYSSQAQRLQKILPVHNTCRNSFDNSSRKFLLNSFSNFHNDAFIRGLLKEIFKKFSESSHKDFHIFFQECLQGFVLDFIC